MVVEQTEVTVVGGLTGVVDTVTTLIGGSRTLIVVLTAVAVAVAVDVVVTTGVYLM